MKVIFEWEDGTKYRYDYPETIKGIRHKGLRPINLEVIGDVTDYDMQRWLNDCYSAISLDSKFFKKVNNGRCDR